MCVELDSKMIRILQDRFSKYENFELINADILKVDLNEIINKPDDFTIKAPSEFGLTSLAHYIKLEAWKLGKIFLYVDSKKTKKHKVVKDIQSTLESYYFIKDVNKIDCILLDSVHCLKDLLVLYLYLYSNLFSDLSKLRCDELC